MTGTPHCRRRARSVAIGKQQPFTAWDQLRGSLGLGLKSVNLSPTLTLNFNPNPLNPNPNLRHGDLGLQPEPPVQLVRQVDAEGQQVGVHEFGLRISIVQGIVQGVPNMTGIAHKEQERRSFQHGACTVAVTSLRPGLPRSL